MSQRNTSKRRRSIDTSNRSVDRFDTTPNTEGQTMEQPETELEALPEVDLTVPKGCPTPAEIAEHCRRFQESWSEETRKGRQVGAGRQPWRVPGGGKSVTVWQGRQARPDRGSLDW